jgi:hypothetical protein
MNYLSSFLGMNYNDLIVMSLEGLSKSKGNHDKLIPRWPDFSYFRLVNCWNSARNCMGFNSFEF